jgi:hypothetical protein
MLIAEGGEHGCELRVQRNDSSAQPTDFSRQRIVFDAACDVMEMAGTEEGGTAADGMSDLTKRFAIVVIDGLSGHDHAPVVFVDEVTKHFFEECTVDCVS